MDAAEVSAFPFSHTHIKYTWYIALRQYDPYAHLDTKYVPVYEVGAIMENDNDASLFECLMKKGSVWHWMLDNYTISGILFLIVRLVIELCDIYCLHVSFLLKVVFFGDNVPKDKADKAMEAAKGCDSFLVLGSSVMTMSAFRLVRAAHEAGAATAIVNIGVTRADNFVSLKINARLGEILPRILNIGSLSIPAP
ncbi:hypothetical protein RJ639_038949 [Escallonia herrerae]|uniref:Deacetylase sirtuin-type domain-containing protein n=1 Tax=Escallonia herrerae TaxID=1293975 RepID=A0AA89B7S1_9ASTE|nr:hypothetical protein RJ639_038949 [Escallonia herrerae]